MAQSPPYEVLKEIFNHFINDINYLHACLLVNKNWSCCVVTVLWHHPFHLIHNLSHRIISTYLLCLDNEEKLNLGLNEISISPMYNYPSFMRHLSYYSFVASIQKWCIERNLNPSFSIKILQALFRLFAKYSPSLKTLVLVTDFDDINEFMLFDNRTLRNSPILSESIVSEWISNIKEIELGGDYVIDRNVHDILAICKELKKLKIRMPYFEYDNDSNHYDMSVEMSYRLIKSQKNLNIFTLRESHYSNTIGDALNHQTSKLRHVEFIDVLFDRWCKLDWLPCCEQLESLKFVNSQILSILTPPRLSSLKKLKSLMFEEIPLPIDILEALICSSNNNLREILFGLPSDFEQHGHPQLLYSISNFCTNLTKLGATIGNKEIPSLFLILNNCRLLQCLEIYGNGCILDVNVILPQLGKSIPSTLGEFDIRARWRFNADNLACFLDNTKNVSLYRFAIRIHDFINDEHLSVVEKHSNKHLKYITFGNKNFPVTNEEMSKASAWLRKFIF